MTSAPLVSIVTPFYNTREFLAECIESVLRQSYSNWEYILVDNQSTDGSSEIAANYAFRLSRKVRLVRTEQFLSQVQNYNFALSCIASSSEYCKIVQADDWIFRDCIARMVEQAEWDRSIGIVSSYRLKGNAVVGCGLPYTTSVISGADICRQQLKSSLFTFGTPTTVLYRAEIVRGAAPFYDEKALHEDTEACYRILRTWNYGFIHQVLSFSRIDNDSIMTRARDYHPEYLDRFLQLHKFGPEYLERAEFMAEVSNWKNQYYRFLAKRWLSRPGRPFWDYQKKGLATEGLKFEPATLFKAVVAELFGILANPGTAAQALNRRLTSAARRRSADTSIQKNGISQDVPVRAPETRAN